jgi:cobalt-precorrin-5B (C1)-methyltransferase
MQKRASEIDYQASTNEYPDMSKGARKLRSGFTTGTAAAAAAKGAVLQLLGRAPDAVEVELLTGERMRIALHRCRSNADGTADCTVVKDAGDDPDVTHGAEIGARARLGTAPGGTVRITGGSGVGRVTKPGLDVPPGEPAINPGPRRMITAAVAEAMAEHGCLLAAEIEVFVPAGEEIARKTLNARLGILGGISILGTTGIVRPLSHEAFTATIRAGLSVARAAGIARPVVTTGRRSERFAQARWPDLPSEAFVQIGDYFENALATAAALGFEQVTVAAFFGKALKMAQGAQHTHAGRAELTLEPLAMWAAAVTGLPDLADEIRGCNTAREAFGRLAVDHPPAIAEVGRRMQAAAGAFAGPSANVQAVIFDYAGRVAFDSHAIGGGHA